jgi:hypothetical protein
MRRAARCGCEARTSSDSHEFINRVSVDWGVTPRFVSAMDFQLVRESSVFLPVDADHLVQSHLSSLKMKVLKIPDFYIS